MRQVSNGANTSSSAEEEEEDEDESDLEAGLTRGDGYRSVASDPNVRPPVVIHVSRLTSF